MLEQNPNVEMPDYVVKRIQGKYRDFPIIVDAEQPNATAPTCVAHYAKDLSTSL
jgi:DNA (cytosine-5)-methyltransferase 1